MSYLKKVEKAREANRKLEAKRKLKKRIASLSGGADILSRRSQKLDEVLGIKWKKGTLDMVCEVCEMTLGELTSTGLKVYIPHRRSTCPGPAGLMARP